MQHSSSQDPTALRAAAGAWNNKAKSTSAPMLRHIFATIRNMQRLRSAIRHCGELEPHTLETAKAEQPGGNETNILDSLRDLCARLDRFEEALTQLSEQALNVSQQGESLVADFLALAQCGAHTKAAPRLGFQLHLANWSDGGEERRREEDVRALDRLIEAQKAEIDALNRQLAETEHWLTPEPHGHQPDLPRACAQIEMQSVQEFVQNSPIASIPVNVSYYQRIMEAASSPEGHKVPMGKILLDADVVSVRQLEAALEYQREGRRQALGSLLVDLGYTTEDAIAQALAAQLALHYVVLVNEPIDRAAVAAVPAHLARRHACFPLNFRGHALCVAMANPLDLIALEDLRIASNRHIRPCVAARGEIVSLLDRYYV